MARELTERQQKFLAVLMDEAGGDVTMAKKLAGYSPNTTNTEITNSLKEEILDVTHSYFCLLYTSPSPRDGLLSRMPSSA